jgi:Mor family transcriptional regulator
MSFRTQDLSRVARRLQAAGIKKNKEKKNRTSCQTQDLSLRGKPLHLPAAGSKKKKEISSQTQDW